jgi:hypothetical protein
VRWLALAAGLIGVGLRGIEHDVAKLRHVRAQLVLLLSVWSVHQALIADSACSH